MFSFFRSKPKPDAAEAPTTAPKMQVTTQVTPAAQVVSAPEVSAEAASNGYVITHAPAGRVVDMPEGNFHFENTGACREGGPSHFSGL